MSYQKNVLSRSFKVIIRIILAPNAVLTPFDKKAQIIRVNWNCPHIIADKNDHLMVVMNFVYLFAFELFAETEPNQLILKC